MAMTTPRWLSLGQATTEELGRELAAREEQAAQEKAARDKEAREAGKRRRALLDEVPGRLEALRQQLADALAAAGAAPRPTPRARAEARGCLLGSGGEVRHFDELLSLGSEAPTLDGPCAALFHVQMAAGRLWQRLSTTAPGSPEVDELDDLECEAFAALYARVRVVAGVDR
jgi:hypothetical protein